MNKPTIDEILAPKPDARPRIYAYAISDEAHAGLLKVGQTTREVKSRVAEQLRTAAIKNFRIELDEHAGRDDGSIFSDHEVRAALASKGFVKAELEWMRCTVGDVMTVLTELRTGQKLGGTHHQTFPMRPEQGEAVRVTHGYFQSRWAEDRHAVPRFLWNAKMRFGKTFTSYNHHRPHSKLGGLTPSEFAETAMSAHAMAMDAAILDVYTPMAIASTPQQGTMNRRSELKTG